MQMCMSMSMSMCMCVCVCVWAGAVKCIEEGGCVRDWELRRPSSFFAILPDYENIAQVFQEIKLSEPKFICLNDGDGSMSQDLEHYLSELFPIKSSFEL